MAKDNDPSKTADLVGDSLKKIFKDGDATAKKLVAQLKKAEDPKLMQAVADGLIALRKQVNGNFDAIERVMKVALSQAAKSGRG